MALSSIRMQSWILICITAVTVSTTHAERVHVHSFAFVSKDSKSFNKPLFAQSARLRRGLSATFAADARPDNVHLSIEVDGEKLEYSLTKNTGGFEDGAKVYLQGIDGTSTIDPSEVQSDIVSYKNADAVVSVEETTFNGLLIHNNSVLKFHFEAQHLVLETEHDVAGHCGANASYSIDPVEEIPLGEISHNHQGGSRRVLIDEWSNCYRDDHLRRSFSVGLAMTHTLFNRMFAKDEVKATQWFKDIVSKANLVYGQQFNVELTIGAAYIVKENFAGDTCASGMACEWENSNCGLTLREQLRAFTRWDREEITNERDRVQGVWHLFDDCVANSLRKLGLAYIGVLCQEPYNTGITEFSGDTRSIPDDTWLPFMHEVGHNFGAFHSFEDGQGRTGGIMDYGDFKYEGEYQFNTKYRKEEMCAEISANLNCAAFNVLGAARGSISPSSDGTNVPTTASPTNNPTPNPTTKPPTRNPTGRPTTRAPTKNPTEMPTTKAPTTRAPTTRAPTTRAPTAEPTTSSPTREPTLLLRTFNPTAAGFDPGCIDLPIRTRKGFGTCSQFAHLCSTNFVVNTNCGCTCK